jgi:hypothetical protein
MLHNVFERLSTCAEDSGRRMGGSCRDGGLPRPGEVPPQMSGLRRCNRSAMPPVRLSSAGSLKRGHPGRCTPRYEEATAMTTTTAPVDNGIDIDFLREAREALTAEPGGATFQWRGATPG